MQEASEWLRGKLAEPIELRADTTLTRDTQCDTLELAGFTLNADGHGVRCGQLSSEPVKAGDHVGLNRAQRRVLRKVRA